MVRYPAIKRFIFSNAPKGALRLTQFPVQLVRGLFPLEKGARHEADQSPPAREEIKNGQGRISTLAYPLKEC